MGETVTYLDFGTPKIHIAWSEFSKVARCGVRSGPSLLARFTDQPGAYAAEMCQTCLKASSTTGEGK